MWWNKYLPWFCGLVILAAWSLGALPGGGSSAWAEAGAPKEYFEQDLAKAPLPPEPKAERAGVEPLRPPSIATIEPWAEAAGSPDLVDRPEESLLQLPKVIYIGAILNSKEREHVLEKTDELFSVCRDFSLPVGPVYLLGELAEMLGEDYFKRILGRGGVPHPSFKLPPQYQVALSPTWLVGTDQGEMVLEAVADLRNYLNARGEFVEPGGFLTVHNEN